MTLLVVGGMLQQNGAHALGHPASNLTIDDGWVDQLAAVLRDQIALEADQAGLDVHLDDGAVGATGPTACTAVI